MKTIILIYFFINTFFTGMWFEDHKHQKKGIIFWLFTVFMFVGYILFVIVCYIYEALKWVFIFFQVKFFIYFLFNKSYAKNLTQELLERNKEVIDIYYNTNSLRDRIRRYCTHLVFKRNNFKII